MTETPEAARYRVHVYFEEDQDKPTPFALPKDKKLGNSHPAVGRDNWVMSLVDPVYYRRVIMATGVLVMSDDEDSMGIWFIPPDRIYQVTLQKLA